MLMKNRVRELRKQKDFSQQSFAEALNVSRQTVNAIEREKSLPSLELAFEMAKVLGTGVEELFIADEKE